MSVGARLTTWNQESWDLPVLLEWELRYTGGVPCDSVSLTCVYDRSMGTVLPECCRLGVFEDGELRFYGVVDEYTVERSERGELLTITGRGLAALLLDNESTAAVYQRATTRELLQSHVEPYGIRCREWKDLSGAYRIPSGSSQWKALEGFTRTYGGFSPRFTPTGELLCTPETAGASLHVGESTPVLALTRREKRYGVLSEVLVTDKTRGVTQSVRNQEFLRRGGSCRRVLYTPGQSSWSAMRYTGEYQISESQKDAAELSLTMPGGFLTWPGERVALDLEDAAFRGTWRVQEAVTACGSGGKTCRLTLWKE